MNPPNSKRFQFSIKFILITVLILSTTLVCVRLLVVPYLHQRSIQACFQIILDDDGTLAVGGRPNATYDDILLLAKYEGPSVAFIDLSLTKINKFDFFDEFENCETLILNGKKLSKSDIVCISKLPKLEYFFAYGCNLDDEKVLELAASSKLRIVHIGNNSLLKTSTILEFVKQVEDLEVLDISGNNFEEDIENIKSEVLKIRPDLRFFDFTSL
ncbi:MAG: hypothetical protein AAFN77_02220 [Planctomycetota bacterium]